ncbi:hypothetical protein BDV06DRAFT_221221 [Aspergillus oleicola]
MTASAPASPPTAALTATTTTTTCVPKPYDIPATDAGCAMRKYDTCHAIMASCCGRARVIAGSDCSYYCLAQGQTVGDLAQCLIKGSKGGQVWCNAHANKTATEAASITVSASVFGTVPGSEPGSATSGTDITAEDEELRGSVKIIGAQERTVSVKTALLLLLMVLGGVVRPVL